MKRIEAREPSGRVMACWPLDELDRARRLVSLSESKWVLGISEFESEAEADKARLNHLQAIGFGGLSVLLGARPAGPIRYRELLDFGRNAPKPTFTPIEL